MLLPSRTDAARVSKGLRRGKAQMDTAVMLVVRTLGHNCSGPQRDRAAVNVTLDRAEFAKHLSFVHELRKVPIVFSPEEAARFPEVAPVGFAGAD